MINKSFQSALKQQMNEFISFKRAFGHSYEKQTYHLLDFDRYCCEHYPDRNELAKEMVLGWASIRETETSNGYISRITTIRQLGKYLVMNGNTSFILPEGLKGGDMPLMPYIFTEASLNQFFTYTDCMERYYQSTIRHLVAPVMFRFMYCCGLRPREARALRRSDINYNSGRVFIRESKYCKERIIYAADDLIHLTMKYVRMIEQIYPDSDALFLDRKGQAFSYSSQQYLFEHCRDNSELKWPGTKAPNLYSFRHTFATFRIYQWCKEGKELGTYLPRLSAYMGHNCYEHTLYYLHLVPEVFSEMTGFDFEMFSEIIPEVTEYD